MKKYNIITIKEGISSNEIAHELANYDDTPEFTVVNLLNQTKGKGRGTNKWFSELGKSLTFSIIVYPRFLNSQLSFYISKLTSIAVVEALQNFSHKIKIKWPNDIYFNNKKLGGILIENCFENDKITYSIVGIGINVNQTNFPSELPNPISLLQITGDNSQLINLENTLYKIIRKFVKWYTILKNEDHNGYAIIDKTYFKYLTGRSKTIEYKTNDEKILKGKIISVDEFGFINIKNSAGIVLSYNIDEIKLIKF
ncbi:MAG: biotin--[acetyl-CoA-carboxylase] ligase [Bacteroidales bacterium]|nr:biotin--[acetyl-CoA-carboxylase] ligase [Bacteroidales bacterium]